MPNNLEKLVRTEAYLFNFKFTCGAFMTLGKTNICRRSGLSVMLEFTFL